ncbi:MAG: FTR1 family protein, partial [Elusimicrobia bacterium]|nr:FTR1 family protein [Elusimicrobiota bacterium]
MLQAFIVVLREGFESFLLAAVTLSYLKKTARKDLAPAVYVGAGASVLLSAGLGYVLMRGVDEPLWEGVLGIVAIVMVTSLVVHMWRTAPLLKKNMERRLDQISTNSSRWSALLGVFVFTLFMISREGMETALALIQIRDTAYISGIILGLIGTIGVSWMWVRVSHLINLKRFFQVTGVFLILFMVQVAIYSFHEFCEAGVFAKSAAWHVATEPYSPDGI